MYLLAATFCIDFLGRLRTREFWVSFHSQHNGTQKPHMFTLLPQGAAAPTVPPVNKPVTHTEPVRLLMFGSLSAVQAAIKDIHRHGYAEPNDWSQPISTGRTNEVMAILTKRVSVE